MLTKIQGISELQVRVLPVTLGLGTSSGSHWESQRQEEMWSSGALPSSMLLRLAKWHQCFS